jgi:hypothetical protein
MRVVALILAGIALAGCESSQTKSARLERAAKRSAHEKGLSITQPSRDVTVGRTAVLQDANGVATVIELQNKSPRALLGVPVAFQVRDASKAKLYANDAPGLDSSLVRVPALAPGGRLDWVNDQVTLGGQGADVVAEAGADAKPGPAQLPRLDVSGLSLKDDPASGLSIAGKVANRSSVEQVRLIVFVVGRKGDKIVTAGRAIVPKLPPGGSAEFSAFPIGNPRGAQLEASAPPTVTR